MKAFKSIRKLVHSLISACISGKILGSNFTITCFSLEFLKYQHQYDQNITKMLAFKNDIFYIILRLLLTYLHD